MQAPLTPAYDTPKKIEAFRCIVIANALEMYAKSIRPIKNKFKMKANSSYTPKNMLATASAITGKTFKRGQYWEAAAALREFAGK